MTESNSGQGTSLSLLERLRPASPRLPAAAGGSFSHLSYCTEGEALAALSRACILHLWNGPRRSHLAETFTTSQVAEICQVSPSTVSQWFDSGRLGGYRRPGSLERSVRREWLFRFLRENDIPFGASFPDWGEGDLEGDPSTILLGWDPQSYPDPGGPCNPRAGHHSCGALAAGSNRRCVLALARSVYQSNDRRSALKRQINALLGSAVVEEKSAAG